MTNLLLNGDYVADGHGGICRCGENESLLAEVLFRLTCRKGAFPLLPNLGSDLWRLPAEKPTAQNMMARQYAAEALEDLDVTVEDASVAVTEDAAAVRVTLRRADDTFSIEVSA